ncbi:MAG TPA: hypothetical protein VKK81_12485 [Candidatus Binatia bacterium]|nr:hypothetical protein [Candidatus Binatia bacterium]
MAASDVENAKEESAKARRRAVPDLQRHVRLTLLQAGSSHIYHCAVGGTADLDNPATLCDLCHAVYHWHMGPAWCGVSTLPLDQQGKVRALLAEAEQAFQGFLL